jgi:hypothetical protein
MPDPESMIEPCKSAISLLIAEFGICSAAHCVSRLKVIALMYASFYRLCEHLGKCAILCLGPSFAEFSQIMTSLIALSSRLGIPCLLKIFRPFWISVWSCYQPLILCCKSWGLLSGYKAFYYVKHQKVLQLFVLCSALIA